MSPRSLSVAALWAGILAGLVDLVAIIEAQPDKGDLVWPLILLPVVLVPAPVVFPRAGLRVAAALLMTGWCAVTTFSLGPAFLPCLLVLWIAARRENQPRSARSA